MVKHTRKNKLGGKKMRNKKVSSRKYKKGGNYGNYGNYFGTGREGIKVKLYHRYVPDPFGQEAELNIGDKITGTIELGSSPLEGNFEFKGYNKNKNEMHVKLLQRKLDGGFVEPNQHTEFTINPQQFNEKFYIQDKKINLIDPTNITTIKGGGKRRTLKTLKKSKKVKKSRKNRK